MSEVERFNVGPDPEHPGYSEMHPHPKAGAWVRYSDYQALEARVVELPMPPDTLIKVGMLADVEGHGDGLVIEMISVTLQPRRDPAAEGVEAVTEVGSAVEIHAIEAALVPYAVFDLGDGGWCYGRQVRRVCNEDGSE